MDLRVTLQTLVNLALTNTRLQTGRLGKLQEQASSGKRINVPSDDPVSVAGRRRSEATLSNLHQARSPGNKGPLRAGPADRRGNHRCHASRGRRAGGDQASRRDHRALARPATDQ